MISLSVNMMTGQVSVCSVCSMFIFRRHFHIIAHHHILCILFSLPTPFTNHTNCVFWCIASTLAEVRVTCQILYSLRPAEPHVLAYAAQQNPPITLHLDLIPSLANARSHTLVPHRGTLFPQTCVHFQTAVVLNQNLKPIFFNLFQYSVIFYHFFVLSVLFYSHHQLCSLVVCRF